MEGREAYLVDSALIALILQILVVLIEYLHFCIHVKCLLHLDGHVVGDLVLKFFNLALVLVQAQ